MISELLTTTWLIPCRPDSAWAIENWAEIAKQLGKILELHKQVLQNLATDLRVHPVRDIDRAVSSLMHISATLGRAECVNLD